MRSIRYSEGGSADVLRLVERETVEPAAGEVRVRLAVSGVNPVDWQARRGLLRPVETETVPNQDGAGVVDAVGPDVAGLKVGQRVWTELSAFGRPLSGTAQELAVLPSARVHPLPDSASFDVGASLGVRAITAHRALTVTEGLPSRLAPGALADVAVLVAGGAGRSAMQPSSWRVGRELW